MGKPDLQQSMYELPNTSAAQRITSAIVVAAWVALVWWLLLGTGLTTLNAWFGWHWPLGNLARRICLAAAFSVYYIRILFTWYVFLKRGVSWSETLTIAIWILCIYLFLAGEGGTNPAPWSATTSIGVALFATGSWMNTYAEHARNVWKQQPANHGHLYTEGLFRYVRHPNYLGDLLSFSGLCFIAGRWLTAIIPAIMLLGFVFASIPALDAHLHKRYGSTFDNYARHTRKLIPFLY